ncbi:MAG: TolC family protein, partial [Nitrospira sp.]
VNEENAQFQQAELAGPQAEIKVAQKRQDLYLAGAVQYWDWQVAVKQADVVKRALAVADERYRMVEGRSKAGAVAPIDVVEAKEEVQRRREAAIAAQRKVEYEQYKLALFLWENGEPVTPRPEWAPEFTGETPLPSDEDVAAFKVEATEDRPEVRDLYIEAKMNNVELKLAKNGLLPKLTVEGGPAIGSIYWVGGVGYRVATLFSMPLFNRTARGKALHAEAQQERLVWKQAYAERQVQIDVDNWLSAQVRARRLRQKLCAWPRRWKRANEPGLIWEPRACSSSTCASVRWWQRPMSSTAPRPTMSCLAEECCGPEGRCRKRCLTTY